VAKISKSDQDPHQTDKDKTEIEKILSRRSRHFEPGTFVTYKNKRYLLLCYRASDGKMVLDSGIDGETLALDTYSMQWR